MTATDLKTRKLAAGKVFGVIPMRRTIRNLVILGMSVLFLMFLYTFSSIYWPEAGKLLVFIQFAWFIFLGVLLFLDLKKWFFTAFWLALTLYHIMAWLIFFFRGIMFSPFPSIDILYSGSVLSLKAIISGFIISSIIFINTDWNAWMQSSTHSFIQQIQRAPRYSIYTGALILLILGAIGWVNVGQIGLEAIIANERRAYISDLPIADHNIRLIYTAVSIFIALAALARRRERPITIASLIISWSPVLLVGSRHFLVVTLIAFFLAIASSDESIISTKNRRIFVFAVFPVSLLVMLSIAAIWRRNAISSLNEFILPQYMLFSLMGKNISIPYDSFRGFWLMFPNFVRPVKVVDLGTLFKNLGMTSVGVGANPVAAAYLDSPGHTILFFSVTSIRLLLIVYYLGKFRLAPAILSGGLIFIFGRSDFWVVLWFFVYSAIVIKLFITRIRIQ